MTGILLVTHGGFAKEIVESAELIIGSQDCYKTLGLVHGDDIGSFKDEVLDAIKTLESGDGVLVFADLYGGSPFNTVAKILNELNDSINLECISGVNLPMVLEAFLNRDDFDLNDLKEHCLSIGVESIKDMKEELY